jgi:hypothetical protein
MNVKREPLISPIQTENSIDNLDEWITQLCQFFNFETLAPEFDLIQILPVINHEDVFLGLLSESHFQMHSNLPDESESDEVRFRRRQRKQLFVAVYHELDKLMVS